MRCSSCNTRAASACSVSWHSTGTAAWMMIGPWARAAVTEWTVQPCILTPARKARGGGQKGGMNVQEPGVIARHKTCGEDAHETCQHHEIGMESIDKPGKRGIEAVAIRIVAVFEIGR